MGFKFDLKLAVFFSITVLYILTIKGVSGNLYPSQSLANHPPFETSMERGRYAQIVSLVQSKNFNVDEFYEFLRPDVAWYNKHFYSTFPIGMAVVSVPLYLLGSLVGLSQVAAFFTASLFSILTALLVYKTCKRLNFNTNVSIFASVVYALTSSTWAYSVSLSAHPFSAFTIILGFYTFLSISTAQKNILDYLVIGLLFGLCFFVDYPNILIFLPILIAALLTKVFPSYSNKPDSEYLSINLSYEPFAALLSFAVVMVLFVSFNQLHFQKSIAFTNTYTIKPFLISQEGFDLSMLNNEIFEGKDYSERFTFGQAVDGIKTLLISSDRGLFVYAPIYFLSIVGFVLVFRKNLRIALVILFTFLANLFMYGAYDDPWGGWAFGPRYLIATAPLLAILCAYAFDYLVARFGNVAKFIIFLVLVYSASIALLGALTTNAVPPSIEVAGSDISSNFVYNWNYLNKNGVSSFLHIWLLKSLISAKVYGLMVWLLAVVVIFCVVFKKRATVSR